MKVLCCGSRDYDNIEAIRMAFDSLNITDVIHGDARGADRLCAAEAERRGIHVTAFPADWPKYGRRAGIYRNEEMLSKAPDLVLAFWDGSSPGTRHTISRATALGILVTVVTPEGRWAR